jgi:hypothetical protein
MASECDKGFIEGYQVAEGNVKVRVVALQIDEYILIDENISIRLDGMANIIIRLPREYPLVKKILLPN